MVAALNPPWNEPVTDADVDKLFEEASILIGDQFLKKLDFYGKAWLPARDIVISALEHSRSLDPNGRILHLPHFCPWKVTTLKFHSYHRGTSFRLGGRTWHSRSNLVYTVPRQNASCLQDPGYATDCGKL
jgi:uncharacterized UPF0160 family protein